MDKTVLAIDPGTRKCGMALVQRTSGNRVDLRWRAIAEPKMVIPKLHEAYVVEPFQLIVIGGGTNSDAIIKSIRSHIPSMGLLVVDEKDTSLQARERYWEHHPRKGWRRFVPSTLQVPPEEVDDFVALILAERVLMGT
jgi:RNase H-fold protein (predicted Holliday junction resolvase)